MIAFIPLREEANTLFLLRFNPPYEKYINVERGKGPAKRHRRNRTELEVKARGIRIKTPPNWSQVGSTLTPWNGRSLGDHYLSHLLLLPNTSRYSFIVWSLHVQLSPIIPGGARSKFWGFGGRPPDSCKVVSNPCKRATGHVGWFCF